MIASGMSGRMEHEAYRRSFPVDWGSSFEIGTIGMGSAAREPGGSGSRVIGWETPRGNEA